ncbi:N-acetylmuramidase domain-containing protein [Aeromonas enteropelogenes]|uniref:N-acetylmuramidase domain-containing protein n=1 Tax=Aeromonas enteropelogenes TaxID=29489 RepID=UPI001CE2BCC4|nr:N-acetylmuramidase domain-containing protein [Aeromonas enteropelogenes]UCA10823.1 N-acetylmuramidase domain-containing protein [Aeromonas enteropelogenes]
MKFAFPILTAAGEEFKDVKALTALINGEKSGHYLLGNHNKWHGGIHISDQSAPWCKDKYPVRAIADGKVVAFRMMKDYLTSEFQGESLRYSNSFCLVQHEYCEINAQSKAKNEFTFYSLYMHLLPWDHYQTAEKLVLKKGWNARNSVPDANQQRADAALPRFTLPKDTELEMDSSTPSQKGCVGGKEYDFIRVTIKSKISNAQMKEAEKAGVLVSEGSSVWIANSPDAVEATKPNLPSWLDDQIEAELLKNMAGRADPVPDDRSGRLMAGSSSASLPVGTKVQYDAHQLEFHWMGEQARKMARCNYVTPSVEGEPGRCGVAWVCVEDEFIKVNVRVPSHLGELYVLPSPVAIAAGDTMGYLGLVETPGSLIGGKQSKHQVHLEVFTQDPRLDDVLANKAGTKGGTTYAKVPADLILHEMKNRVWVATDGKSQEELVESPKIEKDATKQEWVCISSGKYVKKEQVELLSQHDWLKIGFKKVDGSGSDGYLDPEAPPTFFTDLVNSFDTDKSGELSSEEIKAALQNSGNREQLNKLIVKHPSEWYEKSSASSYLWLDKLMAKIGLPDFDQLVDHEKQRIDKLEWMQSATRLTLAKDSWHFSPVGIMALATRGSNGHPKTYLGDTLNEIEFLSFYNGEVVEESDYVNAASELGCEVNAIKAVALTETGSTGSYYKFSDQDDAVLSILFERHKFSNMTSGKYDKSHPEISNPMGGGYGAYKVQYRKLMLAYSLDKNAALKAASWGKFQILGSNHLSAGYKDVNEFVSSLSVSEKNHLKAFVNFIKADNRLLKAIRAKDWLAFALVYNGPRQKGYDKRMKDNYNAL